MAERGGIAAVVAGLLLALLAFPPAAAAMPAPDGPYPVGFTSTEFTDPARKGVMSGDAREPRTIPASIWYPARATARRGRPYLDPGEARDQGGAAERIFRFQPGELAKLMAVRMPSTRNAPAAAGRFPVVVFSHGYFLYPAQNTALAELLASHGYIVVSIGHLHDAVDLRLANGWLMPTFSPPGDEHAALSAVVRRFTGDGDHDARMPALRDYPAILMASRLGKSLAAWIEDTRFVADALQSSELPALRFADHDRLILAGMSFGGTTAASTCRLIARCIAAVNLDGENFDPALFDRPVERPLLMLYSDWTKYPLWSGQSRDPAFNPNDLAYERWTEAGTAPDIVRLRLVGATHMAFIDWPAMMPRGPRATERFGTIDPDRAVAAINATTLAFLDVHAKRAPRTGLDAAVRRYPELVPHDPSPIAGWARRQRRSIDLPCIVPCGK
jgi:predicted dienelactone hydrolase